MTIKKPNIKINNNANKFTDPSFYKSCEYFPCLIPLNIKSFYKEGFFDYYKLNFGTELINDKNVKKVVDNNGNIKYYCKKKEKKKFLEENEEEIGEKKNIIGRNNDGQDINNTPKSIKMRNIPEEDRKAMENMINGMEDSDDDEVDVVEE